MVEGVIASSENLDIKLHEIKKRLDKLLPSLEALLSPEASNLKQVKDWISGDVNYLKKIIHDFNRIVKEHEEIIISLRMIRRAAA